jgi:hypothetical protein
MSAAPFAMDAAPAASAEPGAAHATLVVVAMSPAGAASGERRIFQHRSGGHDHLSSPPKREPDM